MPENQQYRFDVFTLDPIRRTLHRGDDEVVLPEGAWLVLKTLVERAPETVDKETLMDVAWPETAVVQDNLVQAIHSIRSALGSDGRNPRFIQTVHRRGYRLMVPVTVINPKPSSGHDIDAAAASVSRRRWSRGRLIGLAASFAVMLVVTAIVIAAGSWKKLRTVRPPVRTLAVLPLENLSGDPDQEYFADGMTDALITELARIEGLDVISRTSVMKFKDTRESVPDIAGELGVDAIVEGTVTRAGGRIRVIAQLVDAGDLHIWGENYEYENQDVLRLQRDLAEAIAREIGARLDPRSSGDRQLVVDPEAYEALLRGHHVLRERTEGSLLRARDYFNRAVSIDPAYAPAYSGLAETFNLMANYGFVPSPEASPMAREMAEKALELDPGLAEAHLALALVAGEYDWNFKEAEREFSIALSLQPSSPLTRSRHAHLMIALGTLDPAVKEMQYARRLDPLSEIITANVGWLLLLNREDRAAESQLLESLEFSPDFAVAHYYLGVLYDRQGRFEEAIKVLERARDLSDGSSYTEAALAHALARSGNRSEAQFILDSLLERAKNDYVSPIGIAVAHFGLGQVDQGFLQLEQAFKERKGWLLRLRVEPALDGLRDDPRYLDLVTRIGLPELELNR